MPSLKMESLKLTDEARIEAWANNKLDSYLAEGDAYDHFVSWAEERDLDPELDDTQEEYNSWCQAQEEMAAEEAYESRQEDRMMESFYGV